MGLIASKLTHYKNKILFYHNNQRHPRSIYNRTVTKRLNFFSLTIFFTNIGLPLWHESFNRHRFIFLGLC